MDIIGMLTGLGALAVAAVTFVAVVTVAFRRN
jgi:hypothetical protein